MTTGTVPAIVGRRAATLVVLLLTLGAMTVPAGAEDPVAGPGDAAPEVPVEVTAVVTASVGLVRSAGGFGSGWVAGDGTVVTNEHVARTRTGDIYIDFSDGERVECYTAVSDRAMDLAVLKCPTGTRPVLDLTTPPAPGTPAAAVGYPGGRGPVTSAGIITGERAEIRGIDAMGFTAAIEPGSSGSPVVDPSGRVVTVATFGGGWGVPAEAVAPLLEIAEGYPATKSGAEWQLRLRRSLIALVVALPLAGLVARRTGRVHPVRFTISWSVTAVGVALAVTQVQFMTQGPAHFV